MKEYLMKILSDVKFKPFDAFNIENNLKLIVEELLKNDVVVLPVKVGVKVWCLAQPCGGCPAFNETLTEEAIEKCRVCDKWEIIECDFDYDLIPEYGKTVFAQKVEAEKKYKELMKHGR